MARPGTTRLWTLPVLVLLIGVAVPAAIASARDGLTTDQAALTEAADGTTRIDVIRPKPSRLAPLAGAGMAAVSIVLAAAGVVFVLIARRERCRMHVRWSALAARAPPFAV